MDGGEQNLNNIHREYFADVCAISLLRLNLERLMSSVCTDEHAWKSILNLADAIGNLS